MPNIEWILDVLERLEDAGVVKVEWDVVEDELDVLGLVHEGDEDDDDEA